MSYVRSEKTYMYPDGDGGVIMHTNQVTDQGRDHEPFRYLVKIDAPEFREFVREVIARVAPSWVKPKMVDDAVDKFIKGERL